MSAFASFFLKDNSLLRTTFSSYQHNFKLRYTRNEAVFIVVDLEEHIYKLCCNIYAVCVEMMSMLQTFFMCICGMVPLQVERPR